MSQARQTSGCSSPIQPAGSPPTLDRAPSGRDAGTAPRPARRRARRRAGRRAPSSTPLSAKKSAGSPPPRQDLADQRPDREAADPVRLAVRRRPLARKVPGKRADGPISAMLSRFSARRRVVQVDAAGLEEGDGGRRRGRGCAGRRRAASRARSSASPTGPRRAGWRATTPSARGSSAGIRSRPGSPGSVKLQPTTSSKPRSRIASSARRRRRCSRLRPPTRPADRRQGAGQVLVEAVDAADLLDQVDLAGDVVVAVGRHGDLEVLAVGLDPEAEPLQVGDLVGLRDRHPEQALDPLAAQGELAAARGSRRRRRSSPAPAWRRRARPSAARRSAAPACRARDGAASRSARRPRSAAPSRREVRRMLVPFQFATSSRTLVVSSETSETWPPMIPAIPEGPLLSQTSTVSASKLRSTSSSVVIFSPSAAARTSAPRRGPCRGRRRAAAARSAASRSW